MIQNLNKFTFAAFGELLPESDATGGFPLQPEWRQESVSFSQDEVWVQRVEHMPTYLEMERGTAVVGV